MTRLSGFLVVQVEVASACNLDCPICLRSHVGFEDGFMSLKDFKRILAPGRFDFVSLHGWGEPLLHPEIGKMIGLAHEQKLITQLTTNATLLKAKQDELLASPLNEIAFGVYELERLKSLSPAIDDFLSARGRAKRPKAYLDVTLTNRNQDQIAALLDLAASLGIEAVILHRLFDRHLTNSRYKRLSDRAEAAVLSRAKDRAARRGLEFYPPLDRQRPCLVSRHSLFVNVKGDVSPCCFQPRVSLGSGLTSGVGAAMTSPMAKQFVTGMAQNLVCKACPF